MSQGFVGRQFVRAVRQVKEILHDIFLVMGEADEGFLFSISLHDMLDMLASPALPESQR